MVKGATMLQADILRIEAEMNNLWGELNTSNISYNTRLEIEARLTKCEEQFKKVLGGEAPSQQLDQELKECDLTLAKAAVQQAENEISKAEHTRSSFQALENVKHELDSGKIAPIKARHEVKEIMRHH